MVEAKILKHKFKTNVCAYVDKTVDNHDILTE